MNVMIRDPFRSKLQFTGNLGMTASKASMQIAAAMWSLRPQVNKNVMKKKNDKFNITIHYPYLWHGKNSRPLSHCKN